VKRRKRPKLPKSPVTLPKRGMVTDPYTGEVDTMKGWAKRHEVAMPTLKQYVELYSWDDYFTFYPLVQKRRRR